MPNYTPNYNLTKPLGSEAYDIAVPNGNMDTLDTTLKRIDNNAPQYVVATGTNTLVVVLDPAPVTLYAGLSFRFYNPSNSTALVTINANNQGAKALRKNGGAQVGANGLKQGIYTVVYDGTSFILQGEGGEYGTAEAAQVLQGYTVGRESGLVAGTLVVPRIVRGTIPGVANASSFNGNVVLGFRPKTVIATSRNGGASTPYSTFSTVETGFSSNGAPMYYGNSIQTYGNIVISSNGFQLTYSGSPNGNTYVVDWVAYE